MDLCRDILCFLLFLLQQSLCYKYSEVFREKLIGTEVDMTPFCTNKTKNIITAVHCQVEKGENGKKCKLNYVPGLKNETECDSRISLMIQNQTVSLRLMDLTPADSGVYYCECVKEESTLKLHLNVTVEESALIPVNEQKDSYNNKFLVMSTFGSSLTAFMIIFVGTLGCIYRGNCYREQTEPSMITWKGEEKDQHEMDTYAALQEPTDDLYHTVRVEELTEVSGFQQIYDEIPYENLREHDV